MYSILFESLRTLRELPKIWQVATNAIIAINIEYLGEYIERILSNTTVYGERGEYTLCAYLLRDLSLVIRIEFRFLECNGEYLEGIQNCLAKKISDKKKTPGDYLRKRNTEIMSEAF